MTTKCDELLCQWLFHKLLKVVIKINEQTYEPKATGGKVILSYKL